MNHKKQAFNLFEDIARLNNVQWNNPKGSYDATKSAALRIEEALEAIGTSMPKETSRELVESLAVQPEKVSEVAAFDSLIDGIYIAIGELHKLGLSPSQMIDGLQVVHSANLMKGGKKDSQGKVVKPDQWEELFAPEPKLQAILDER